MYITSTSREKAPQSQTGYRCIGTSKWKVWQMLWLQFRARPVEKKASNKVNEYHKARGDT